MSVCVVVASDAGARTASHALRAIGWGGVHFEAKPDAAVRMATGGRATVLNVARCSDDEVAVALAELGPTGHDWRRPPPDLSEDEWAVVYAFADGGQYERTGLTLRTAANRLASAKAAFGVEDDDALRDAFVHWQLPQNL